VHEKPAAFSREYDRFARSRHPALRRSPTARVKSKTGMIPKGRAAKVGLVHK
jgi:hypothetical protein